jgi:hypothetical protein
VAASAHAQCVNAVQGPDVIVGDIPDVDHHTTAGPINGKRAYSFGTTSCNLGLLPLHWDDTTNIYPVISQNIYRLKDGRFEQLGQSWLKHGFCALQGTVCCACAPGGTCDDLYPGCSDPYGAGLNGSQGGLGPKFEIDAAAGYIPLNWTVNGVIEPGDTSQTIYKRLQAPQADLANPGALYFFASTYIQPQDTEYGNDNNSQSYRRVTVNPTTYNITLNDITQRGRNALQAWRDHGLGINQPDPSVAINMVLDPSTPPHDNQTAYCPGVADGGAFFLGSKVTDLGNGMYRYEYALQNHNNYRNGGAFRLPLPQGAIVTNAQFRGVPYHSGEPFSNTPWNVEISDLEVRFHSPETFAQNPNTNALRWDTIYNFRFDSNVPPTAGGLATIDLFRPPSTTGPDSLTVPGHVPSAAISGSYTPPNDNCANATTLQEGVTYFNSTNASTDGPDEPGNCTNLGYSQIGNDIWFKWTAPSNGDITVDTCGSSFNTKIAVYAGCPSAPNSAITCNDDGSGCSLGLQTSDLTFTGVAGTTYLIRVGGFNGATGAGQIRLTPPTFTPPPPPQPPANDVCATGARWIADGQTLTGNTALATNDGTASCGNSATSRDVWFRYRPLTGGTVVVTSCGSTFNTVISTRVGACNGAQNTCNDNTNTCTTNASASRVQFVAAAGQLYYIRLAGFNGATGEYAINVTGGGGQAPAANDNCSARAALPLGATPFSTIDTNTDGPVHNACNFAGDNQISNDIWYTFTAPATGTLSINACGADFNTKMAVYNASGCTNYESRLLACNDTGSCGDDASVSLQVTQGVNYTVRVGGANGSSGAGVLNVAVNVPPTCSWQNDGCFADFNNDGGIDGDDVIGFFAAWDANNACGDVNADSGTDGDDVIAFFGSWDASGAGTPGC